jgi:predicted Ser/Thr protein kinase
MNPPILPTLVAANPADSMLLSLARAVACESKDDAPNWPKLNLADPKQREFGDYELLEELGRGGMGVVYRARQASLERDVAIKFIADWFADSTSVVRFLAEARAAAKLLHPNIVPVYEVGSVDGLHYFSMALIEGESLAEALTPGPMKPDAAIALLLKLCDAIDYAHRLGLLHLDLKPANVLIDRRGEPLVADFGLARHMDAKGGVDAQEVSGTPSFMAPEQILIKQYRLTPATDIYALGAILYLCLTGMSPHGTGSADDVLRRAAAGRIRPPRELNPAIARDLDAICMKCLELQPGDRYATAAQLADDLRRTRDGLPVSVRRIGLVERVQRWFKREPKFALATSFAALALVIGAAATTWQWRQAAAERDKAQTAEHEAARQRDRAKLAGEAGAYLFADKIENSDSNKRAESLIAWLRKRLPGDESRQADALTDFAKFVSSESYDATESFLLQIVSVLGVDYRQQMIKALQSGTDPNRQTWSALLAFQDKTSGVFPAYLKAALQARPDDPFVWQMAATFCDWDDWHCLYPQAAEKLPQLDPDNMYSWLLPMLLSSDNAKARAWLHEAARRSKFDDYSLALFGSYFKAVAAANVPAPPLLASPLHLLAPQVSVETTIAYVMTGQFPIAPYARLVRFCGAGGGAPAATDPQIIADCLTVGEKLMRADANATILAQMIGVALVRNLAKGTPLAEEAGQKRRLWEYTKAANDKLSDSQRLSYVGRFIEDLPKTGEFAAWRHRNAYFGLPEQAPADWQPEDAKSLLTARERNEQLFEIVRQGRRLVGAGKYELAVELLAPQEAAIHMYFTKDNSEAWRVPGYLAALGEARAALHQYAAAKINLTEAYEAFALYGPRYKPDARECAQSLIDLYTAWNAAEPGKGYAAKAGEWKEKLASLDASKND